MTASLQAKVPAERPVHPLTVALLADVTHACETLGAQFVLAGAGARDVQLWHIHGIKAPVATRDVDVAVCAVSWDFHHRLVDTLLASGHFQHDAKAQQKLLFRREGDEFSVELDLVPFGPIEAPPGEIAWPPEGDIVMTVLGFQEAVDTAQLVEIGEGLVVPVVSLPAFVLLKLMAWKDRRTIKNTDASDLLFVMRKYFYAGNEERVYEEALDLLEACDFNVEIASAGMLARDARDVANNTTREAVRAMLQSPETYTTLQADLLARAVTHMFGEYVDDSHALLEAFRAQFVIDAPGA
ncbi:MULTISPECIES: nucleotidyl transferase AbiEii/AbiGii toxin family protein [Paraburkholderia]|uniref:Nucleotidyltransferase n=1 Tax=Paraburkholderia guartelaensis TaxID=2546446 RepID=A0A4V2ZUT2_9BURK|nr:nucleotidyl transferase AbiEii/AbiGii toxin family protein [Paraburkholderia guartelaensis]TDG02322.1 nucleotidyltransferase [Paraburkholderia guartelaensis]